MTIGQRLNLTVPESENPFECPLTKKVFVDPVVARDGHTYERQAILDWWRTCGTKTDKEGKNRGTETFLSPTTGDYLSDSALVPNGLVLRAQTYHVSQIQISKTNSANFAELKQLQEQLAKQKAMTKAARVAADKASAESIELRRALMQTSNAVEETSMENM